MKRIATVIFFFLLNVVGLGQHHKNLIKIDSLVTFSYENLMNRFDNELDKNNELARVYAKAYLKKSKQNNNTLEIAEGYSFLAYTYPSIELRLAYLDSAILGSKNITHKIYPALFYINKGGAYEEVGDFKRALDNYLKAIGWTEKNKNQHLEFITKHNIGFLKRRLGKYEEAKAMFKSCMAYDASKKNMSYRDSLSYLQTLSELINTYRLSKQIDSATILNKEGLLSSKGMGIQELFRLNQIVLKYYSGNYTEVVEQSNSLLQKALYDENKYFIKTLDFTNLYLYQAKSYEALDSLSAAVESYTKIDSILQLSNYIIPETKTIYQSLINYYKSIGDSNQQLVYVNKLLRSDSVLDSHYRYVSDRLVKDYDTPILLSTKEMQIDHLEAKRNNLYKGVISLMILICLSMFFLFRFYGKQKKYQKRFRELMEIQKAYTLEKDEKKELQRVSSVSIDVPKEVIDKVLTNLEAFEAKESFLKININSTYLRLLIRINKKAFVIISMIYGLNLL